MSNKKNLEMTGIALKNSFSSCKGMFMSTTALKKCEQTDRKANTFFAELKRDDFLISVCCQVKKKYKFCFLRDFTVLVTRPNYLPYSPHSAKASRLRHVWYFLLVLD